MVTRISHRLFATILALTGLWLSLPGIYLIYLGGSWYYLLAGLAILAVCFHLIKGRATALRLYGALLLLTLPWAIYEADGDFLSLLPRLAFWLGLGLWFYTPWYRDSLKAEELAVLSIARRWFTIPALACVVALAVFAGRDHEVNNSGTQRETVTSQAITDWRHYGNTAGGTRFAELGQINRDNVGQLRELWRIRTGVEHDFKMTPLEVGGHLYLCAAKNIVIAVDANSGDELWRYDPEATAPAEHQYARTCRGLSYYEVADAPAHEACATRIITATVDARLIAVDAQNGKRCKDFGSGGEVNLRTGLGEHLANEYYATSPALVAGDKLVIGGLVLDSQNLGLPSGVVRAYDAVTGDFAWAWDLGRPGEYGEPGPGEEYTRGTPNVWSVMSYDPELNLVYAPTGNAAPDYWGGARRPFDDKWSSAIVALDAATGEPRWKYQTVHHDIWDYDVPAQPVLVDIERDGKRIPSVVVPTKMGELFVLDRRDGTPVHPIEERPVPQEPGEGDYLAPTQPFSSLPHFHPFRFEKDMWGLTPLDQLACRIEYRMMRYEGLYTPPSTGVGSFQFPANFGGFNWGSVSVDADNGLLVAAPMMLGNRTMLVTPERVAEAGPLAAKLLGENHPAVQMDPEGPMPEMGEPDPENPFDHRRIKYYGLTLPFMSRMGTQVPCFEPPWSALAVIDLNTRELLWQRAPGSMKNSGPFNTRSGLPFQVGTPVRAGTLTTRGGLTFLSSTMDSTVRAFDLRDGEVLWSADLPGSGQATPMTYLDQASGKQVLIVTVPNPSWRYPRDPKTGTYTDSANPRDGKGGYVIAYALEEK